MRDSNAVLLEMENEKLYVGDKWSFLVECTLIDCLAAEQCVLEAIRDVQRCFCPWGIEIKIGEGLGYPHGWIYRGRRQCMRRNKSRGKESRPECAAFQRGVPEMEMEVGFGAHGQLAGSLSFRITNHLIRSFNPKQKLCVLEELRCLFESLYWSMIYWWG